MPTTHRPARTAVLLALALPALAWADPPPADRCARLAAEIERTEQLRRDAVEKGETAWKTVLPFAVIARKVGSKVEAGEADKRLTELDAEARREGCAVPPR